MNSKYNLVVCELFNRNIHGYYNYSDKYVNGHYLCSHVSRNRSIFDDRDYDSDDDELFAYQHLGRKLSDNGKERQMWQRMITDKGKVNLTLRLYLKEKYKL